VRRRYKSCSGSKDASGLAVVRRPLTLPRWKQLAAGAAHAARPWAVTEIEIYFHLLYTSSRLDRITHLARKLSRAHGKAFFSAC
jgi:hypothetical protein